MIPGRHSSLVRKKTVAAVDVNCFQLRLSCQFDTSVCHVDISLATTFRRGELSWTCMSLHMAQT